MTADDLKQRILELETFMATPAYVIWFKSRSVEIASYNENIALRASNWDEVLTWRGRRDSTTDILETFGELRDALKTELEQTLKSETTVSTRT